MNAGIGLKKVVVVSLAMLVTMGLSSSINDSSAKGEGLKGESIKEVIRPALVAPVVSFRGVGIRTFPAIIKANEKTDLAFRVAGQLTHLTATASKRVKKGALLARVDSSDYKNVLEDRIAKLNLAKTQHRQTSILHKKNYASQSELDVANSQLRAAEVAVKQAKANISYTRLHAPFSGVIAQVNVKNYQFIQPQQTIVQLQSTKQLDVHFDVPESLVKSLGKMKNYTSLCGTVSFNGDSKKLTACYKEHDTVPDPQTRTYPVLFSLKKAAKTNLIPGMSVDLSIDLSGLSESAVLQGLLVPVESVFDDKGKQWVWKLDQEMVVHKTQVGIGGINKGMMRITSGLSSSDKVIAAGVTYLSEGQKVRALSKERGL